jgi:hypothetical protein
MTYAILFVLLIPIGVTLFVLFDLIVRLEHKRHKKDWEKDQKPIGIFWRPRGALVWSGSVARSKARSNLVVQYCSSTRYRSIEKTFSESVGMIGE